MKTCFKCNIEKKLTDFYIHKQMADGHLNKCKECTKLDCKKHKSENIKYYRDYERKRSSLPHAIDSKNKYLKTEKGKAVRKIATENWNRKNPIKKLASTMVRNAINSGKIKKGFICEQCKSTPKIIHGHHDDYAFPLVVRWLCPGCHNKWHKENGEGLNAS